MTDSPNLLLTTTLELDFVRTSHLDRLRYQGVQFTRAYAQTSICVPARSAS